MANNPSYVQTALPVTSLVQYQEHVFHMYAQTSDSNDFAVVPATTHPNKFGQTNVLDWDIHDGPETGSNVVAQFRGLAMASGRSSISWHTSSNIVFTDQRYKGSTLSVHGTLTTVNIGDEGDMAVVGGTGQFACAQGTLHYKKIQFVGSGSVLDLQIRAVCLTFPKPKPVQKVGPWGGNGGTAYEIQPPEVPQRLVSITIYDDEVIESIEFSYTDQAGQNQTVGPWGGDSGKSVTPPIQFGDSEIVKEIYGATGKYNGRTVVTSLTIVTNVMAYGPYGKQARGNIPFHVAAPNDQSSIVGFYGSADGEAVNQIGAYVICPN